VLSVIVSVDKFTYYWTELVEFPDLPQISGLLWSPVYSIRMHIQQEGQGQQDRAYYNFINSCKSENTREK
jgi:hypothetical protein